MINRKDESLRPRNPYVPAMRARGGKGIIGNTEYSRIDSKQNEIQEIKDAFLPDNFDVVNFEQIKEQIKAWCNCSWQELGLPNDFENLSLKDQVFLLKNFLQTELEDDYYKNKYDDIVLNQKKQLILWLKMLEDLNL